MQNDFVSDVKILTQKYLREILHYDADTGVFTWRISRAGVRANRVAGWREKKYIRVEISGKTYGAHRLAWLYVYGEWPDGEIDFINGDGADIRIINLRKATHAENAWNAKKSKSNTSGVKGVNWHKQSQKWRARCLVNGKRYSLGCFTSLAEAEQVVREFREKNHGVFANHGEKGGRVDA